MAEIFLIAKIFLKIVNMSISAGWIVLAVLLFRALFKKAPKWITVLLWGIVALRLICPFSIESVMSLIPSAETIDPEIMMDKTPEINTGIPIIDNAINPGVSSSLSPGPVDSVNPLEIWIPFLSVVWIIGMVILLVYTVISCLKIRKKVSTGVRLRENIFQIEAVVSPFVFGVIQPKIYLPYLPFNMTEQDMEHVIAHEQAHIRRKDHLWKPIGFLLLTLHWFNPFMWLGYILLCKDIELACDEKVIKEFTNIQKADYSQALLACSTHRRMIAACPIAFGEVGVKGRVKAVLNYKKSAFWVIITATLATILVAVCFLTNPITSNKTEMLLDVLNNEGTFINESGESVYLKNHKPFDLIDAVPEKYALVDIGCDGNEELIVHITSDIGAYTVFHIYNDNVYGFDFWERELVNLKADGTFVQSSGAGLNSFVTLRFKKDKYEIIEQAYIDDTAMVYRINGVSSTSELANKYIDEFYNKPAANWGNVAGYQDQNQDYHIVYKQFLEGKKPALDGNAVAKLFKEYLLMDFNAEEYTYAYFDMTGDGIPELCVDTIPEMYFFTIKNGELHHWYTETSVYGQLLNNGAFLRERHGAAPEHINFEYYELDTNAKVQCSIAFSWWDKTTVYGKEYPEFYEINGQKISKKEYEEQTKKYLTIGTDKIIWYDKEEAPL